MSGKKLLNIFYGSIVLLLAAMLSFTGCKNASDSGSEGVKGFASGVITAKGSIFVNGIEYDTTSSAVTVDNLSGGDSDLKVGMVVDVKGTIDTASGTGVANEVDYASSIEGTIDSIDTVAGTLYVFGLYITTSTTTVYENTTGLSTLSVGDRVEVSGIVNGTNVLASRIELSTDTGDYKLRGTVSSLAAGSFTLTMETGYTLIVNYTGTLDTGIVDGSEVKIEVASAPSLGEVTTTADKIELKHELSIDDGDRVEIEGVVENLAGTDPVTFTVRGVEISASAALATGLANGTEVEVKGSMTSGVLTASEISTEEDADLEIKGVVVSADAAAGTFVINGVTVYTNHDTIFYDDTAAQVPQFGVDDLASGDALEVKLYAGESGNLIAAKVERGDPPETEAKMNGVVSAINSTYITVNGLSIDTTPLFGNTTIRDSFLSSLTVDSTVVKFTGTISGTAVTWTQVELD